MFPFVQEILCSQNIPWHCSLLWEAVCLMFDYDVCMFLENYITISNSLYDKTDKFKICLQIYFV